MSIQERELRLSKIKKWVANGIAYQNSKNFRQCAPMWINYVEGKQWDNFKFPVPKVKINFLDMIVDNTVSTILSSDFALNYISSYDNEAVEKFNRFAKYQQKEMEQGALDRQALYDGSKKGTYVFHYYWQEDTQGKKGLYKGALRGEVLDFLNCIVANPLERDCQQQEYIILIQRCTVDSVKKMAQGYLTKEEMDLIRPDDLETPYEQEKEQEGQDLCTVYLRYFRINGEVYFEKATNNVMLCEPRPLNPELNKQLVLKKEDTQIEPSPDVDIEKGILNEDKFYLYPVEINVLKYREKCIYGIGDVEGLIENQKAFNLFFASTIKNQYDTGFNKVIIKEGAIEQELTGEPGEIIYDKSKTGDGIKYLQGQQYASGSIEVADKLLSYSRLVSSATEVMTGQAQYSQQSARSIEVLQEMARQPIDSKLQLFLYSKERCGKIWELFYKFYYEKTDYIYEKNSWDYENEKLTNENTNRYIQDTFNGEEYKKVKFHCVVEAGRSSRYSEELSFQLLNTLYLNGTINNMTSEQLEQFCELCDSKQMPFKEKLRTVIRKQKQSELGVAREQIQQLQATIQQLQEALVMANTLNENLKTEFNEKITMSNEEIKNLREFLSKQEVTNTQ